MRNLSNISASHTHKVEDMNPMAWHQGIPSYGFWAIVIEDPVWLSEFDRAREHVADLVLPNYQRRAHLTLSACGLVDEAYFSAIQLEKQIEALGKLSLQPFYIELAGLDSFESAPYISIGKNKTLSHIRRTLESIHQDDPATEYHPHLTLGFYQETYDIEQIKKRLSDHQVISLPPLLIEKLSYCHYQTRQVQGDLQIIDELSLYKR